MTLMSEVAVLVDCEHKTAPVSENGEYFAVGTPAMRGNVIDYQEARRINRAAFKAWTRRMTPRAGDILFAREAPVGPAVRIPEAENVAPGQRTVLIRANVDVVDDRFLFYRILSPEVQSQAQSLAAGSTVPHLNVADVRQLELGDVPQLVEQSAIGRVLGALDDKIDANMKLVDSCVDLQTVLWRRGARGRPKVPLTTVSSPLLGGTPKRSDETAWGGGIRWASVRDLTAAQGEVLLETAESISAEVAASARRLAPLPAGSIAVTARGTVGHVVTLGVPAAINQSAYAFVPPAGHGVSLRLAIESVVGQLRAHAHGSVFSTITVNTLDDAMVPDMFGRGTESLASHLEVLESRRTAALKENRRLAATRDELLPLLMNGKITVKDAEKTVEDVV